MIGSSCKLDGKINRMDWLTITIPFQIIHFSMKERSLLEVGKEGRRDL